MIEKTINDALSIVGLKPAEMNTIEFQEIIPGIKPPRVPLVIPGLEKLPLLPGWTVRNPRGVVVNEGMKLPTAGDVTKSASNALGIDEYPAEPYQLSAYQTPPIPPIEDIQLSAVDYYPEEAILSEVEDMTEPLTLSADSSESLTGNESLELEDEDVTLTGDNILL